MTKLSTKPALIAEALAEEIIRGEIPPGSRLGQDHIADRFQSSHVPVREALQRLVQMELATTEPRRGVRVFSLSPEDHLEIQEMRLALEPLALHRATSKMTSAKLIEIEAARTSCDNASEPIGWEKANRTFHLTILDACERPRLLQRIAQLQRLSAHRFHSRWREDWVKSSDRDHGAIVHALARADAQAACQVLIRHLRR
ncbi:GntR family transcriptional regulator [Yoonia vestfoldensis]|uniref:HTH-type transcriptional regulator McbR n=1 Tax=Yoonia vestfoldensis TaxID=245188 RepID=A0A1Y0E7R4_9RHOB|nr:GntR family transcriptional regulator [Yoonia vestfoldensis]ART99410.1 HTH-type transcriptional regulator McbR [Yoonia vestfoldensis]